MPIKKHMVYGVTGYIGSGKTFLCNELQKIAQEQDIALHIIQVDEIRRSISDTSIERIRGIIQQQLEKSEGIILLERAMLIPDQMQDLVHSMIFVSCSPEIQKERLKNGDLGQEEINRRIEYQKRQKIYPSEMEIQKENRISFDTTDDPPHDAYIKLFRTLDRA